MNTKNVSTCFLFLGLCLLVPLTSQADVINYGNFAGDNVNFLNVTETSAEIGPVYGAPTVSGDSLNWVFPPGFISQSVAGAVDFVDGGLSFVVDAQDGFLIESITVSEFGAYFDNGDDSTSIVSGIAFVQIGNTLYDSTFFFENTGTGAGPWQEDLTISFPAVDSISFFFDNQLFTNADDDGAAFIDKKGISIDVGTVPGAIPEPTSGMLMAIGFVAMAARRRRS